MKSFKDRLAALKRSRRTPTKEIARFCNVAPSTVSDWLAGRHMPRSQSVVQLAEFFDVPTDYLVHGNDDRDRSRFVSELREMIPDLPTSDIAAIHHIVRILHGKTR